MDREKERAEQAAFDAHNTRRLKRSYLRGFMQAYIEYATAKGSMERGFAVAQILLCTHTLRLMGFTRFGVLRKHARKMLRSNASLFKNP